MLEEKRRKKTTYTYTWFKKKKKEKENKKTKKNTPQTFSQQQQQAYQQQQQGYTQPPQGYPPQTYSPPPQGYPLQGYPPPPQQQQQAYQQQQGYTQPPQGYPPQPQPSYAQPPPNSYTKPPSSSDNYVPPETPPPGYGTQENPYNVEPPPYAPPNYQEIVQVPVEKVQGVYVADLLLWIFEVAGVVLVILGVAVFDYNYALLIPGCIALAIGVIGILVQLCISSNSKYLRHILHERTAAAYVDSFRGIAPKLTMHIECYHYETRYRTITETVNGQTRTRTETYTERVVTYSGSKDFIYELSSDFSGRIVGLESYSIAKLKLETEIVFADDYTRQCFVAEEAAFIAYNRYRDVHYNYSRNFYIPGLNERILSFVDPSNIPFYISFSFFLLSHLFLMQYFYILMLRGVSTQLVFKYRKTVQRRH